MDVKGRLGGEQPPSRHVLQALLDSKCGLQLTCVNSTTTELFSGLRMETCIMGLDWGHIGVMEKRMEICILGICSAVSQHVDRTNFILNP